MSNNLYEEAISAAEQIKEAAESRVKQQLIEAMSPKIKQMIQETYLQEDNEYGKASEENIALETKEQDQDDQQDQEDQQDQQDQDAQQDQEDQGGQQDQEDNVVEISEESVKILNNMISESQKKKFLKEKMQAVREGINHLKKAIILAENNNNSKKIKRKFIYAYQNLLKELKNIKSSSIIKTDKTLLKEFLQLSKELNNMSRSRSSRSRYLNENLEELLEMNLFEEEEEERDLDDDDEAGEEEEELGAPEEDSDAEGLMVPREVAEMSLEELIAAVEGASDSEDEELDVEGFISESDDEDLEVHQESDCEDEEGLEAVEEMESYRENDSDEEGLEAVEEGLYLEIDENMLKREISNMKRLREGEASEMSAHFGGGELEKDLFVNGVDLNALDGESLVPTLKLESALRKAVAENHQLKSNAKQYKNALQGMKQQLSEMNLFNAKLLYANKLMQNRDLSIKQQRHIVESLDEAGTLNEAKLLFESLSKSLSRPAKKSGNLNESTSRRNLGSASRSVRSAQPINEGVALDRWATLAGIKK